jgi:hypothetical protein
VGFRFDEVKRTSTVRFAEEVFVSQQFAAECGGILVRMLM